MHQNFLLKISLQLLVDQVIHLFFIPSFFHDQHFGPGEDQWPCDLRVFAQRPSAAASSSAACRSACPFCLMYFIYWFIFLRWPRQHCVLKPSLKIARTGTQHVFLPKYNTKQALISHFYAGSVLLAAFPWQFLCKIKAIFPRFWQSAIANLQAFSLEGVKGFRRSFGKPREPNFKDNEGTTFLVYIRI